MNPLGYLTLLDRALTHRLPTGYMHAFPKKIVSVFIRSNFTGISRAQIRFP